MADKPKPDEVEDDTPFDASTITIRRDPAAIAAHNDPRFSKEAILERRRVAAKEEALKRKD